MIFQEYIKNVVSLSDNEVKELLAYFHKIKLNKGDFLFQQGDVCNKIFFMENGLARIFYYSEGGKDVTAWFSDAKSFITAIDSFQQKIATRDNCELLEDSVLYMISMDELERLLNQNPHFALIAIHFFRKITNDLVDFIVSIKFQSAKEKYASLIQQHPHIFQRVSSLQIASYLGISPETLSRLRAEK